MADHQIAGRGPGWRGNRPTGGGVASQRRFSRGTKIFLVLFAIAALIGTTIAIIILLIPPPTPYFMALGVSEYGQSADYFPVVNPMIKADREALQAKELRWETSSTVGSQKRDLFLKELASLKDRQGSGFFWQNQPVILYLSACALVEDGEIYILPDDAQPGRRETWVAFTTVLGHFQKCPAKQKLLLVDLMRPIANPRLGILGDDVAAHIKKALEAIKDPDRIVITACAEGQFSQTSEILGRSTFAYYLEQGLRGPADGFGANGKDDNRLYVSELAEFLKVRVDRWAVRHRGVRQTPMVYGLESANRDFALAGQKIGGSPKRTALGDSPVPWGTRTQWWEEGQFQHAPPVYLQLEARLHQGESRFRAGYGAEEVRKDADRELAALSIDLKAARDAVPRPANPRSLAQLVAAGQKPPDEAAIKEFKAIARLQFLEKPEKDKVTEALNKFKEKYEGKPFERSWIVFETAAGDTELNQARVNFYYEVLRHVPPPPQYVETVALRSLFEMNADVFPDKEARRYLQVVRLGEEAAAKDPRAFPWVRGLLDAAAQKRHNAEMQLLTPGYGVPADADSLLLEAQREYSSALDAIDKINRAHRQRDEAMALLPGFALYLIRCARADAREVGDWESAVRAAMDLQDVLARAPAQPPSGPDLDANVNEIKRKSDALFVPLNRLRRLVDSQELKKLAEVARSQKKVEDYLKIVELLEIPWIDAKDRADLWGAARTIAERLQEEQDTEDKDDRSAGARAAKAITDSELSDGLSKEKQRRSLRASLSIQLLRLAGLRELADLDQALANAERNLDDPRAWDGLAGKLLQSWQTRLPEHIKGRQEKRDLADADRAGRVFYAGETVRLPASIPSSPDVIQQQNQAKAKWTWIGERYLYESVDMTGKDMDDFYRLAAREYLRTPLSDKSVDRAADDLNVPKWAVVEGTESLTLSLTRRSDTQTLEIAFGTPLPAAPLLSTSPIENERLKIESTSLDGQPGSRYRTTLTISIPPSGESSRQPTPRGFLVRVQTPRWVFHRKTPIGYPPPAEDQPRLALSSNPDSPVDPTTRLRIRPNHQQKMFLYVQNPTGKPRKLTVQLSAKGFKPVQVEVSLTAEDKFKPVPLPGGAELKPGVELQRLDGPLVITLIDAEKKIEIEKRSIVVEVMHPREYVHIEKMWFLPPTTKAKNENELAVQLKALQNFGGDPSRIELEIPLDRNSGLLGLEGKEDTLRGPLPPKGPKLLDLTAKNLRLNPAGDEQGVFFINVDDYKRAFVVPVTFLRIGTGPVVPSVTFRPAINLKVDPAIDPKKLRFTLEVDEAAEDAVIRVGIQPIKGGEFREDFECKGGRRKRIGFALGGDGALLFDSKVSDWEDTLDVAGILGPRLVRARFVSASDVEPATVRVVLDNSPPTGVGFVGKPDLQAKKGHVLVRAVGEDRDSDIADVQFFVGKPENNTVPAKTETFKGEKKGDAYVGEIPIPPGHKGSLTVSVVFYNGVKMAKAATTTIEDTEPPKKGARIAGIVRRAETGQAGFTVVLLMKKGNAFEEDRKTTTSDDGKYAFEDVAPGQYQVYCVWRKETPSDPKNITLKEGADETINFQVK